MKLQLDKEQKYGFVLEGGGAKGSYQIGAWKAFAEAGIRVSGVAGASVGSLNGAMICMGNVEHACEIWENITYSKVMDIDDTMMEKIFEKDWKGLNLHQLLESGGKVLKEGGFDVTPLRKLISEAVDVERIRASETELYIRTISLSDRKPLVVDVKKLEDNEIADMLLASAYLPAFKRERLEGKLYLDGGMYDNVPVDVLLDKGYDHIVELRINGIGIDRHTQIPENVTLYKVEPSVDLGGILEFDAQKSKRNIKLGYYDAMRLLYGLKGIHYYIDADYEEAECYESLVHMFTGFYKREGRTDMTLREINEKVFPRVAAKICKNDTWTYETFYLRLLEHTAKELEIPRFNIYKKDELLGMIKEKVKNNPPKEVSEDHFVELFME
ncbi:MAG: patatin-like phospholipase family protein [Lachnospiraceae bacterium]|nr:patatin-like phospholipase family protein [Lachnospiraceae bacterium]MDD3616588.1 patatin-like phospholipase family protein [Lachnospiraceae bacterium]